MHSRCSPAGPPPRKSRTGRRQPLTRPDRKTGAEGGIGNTWLVRHSHPAPAVPSVRAVTTPLFELNNGVEIPALGFGVFQTPPDETIAAVETALATGYRHIDTAAAYFNEREVGEAIRRSGLDRSEIFVETKIWISDYGYDETLHAFDKSV